MSFRMGSVTLLVCLKPPAAGEHSEQKPHFYASLQGPRCPLPYQLLPYQLLLLPPLPILYLSALSPVSLLPSPLLPSTQLLEHFVLRLTPSPGPLHWLFSLTSMFFPRCYFLSSYSVLTSKGTLHGSPPYLLFSVGPPHSITLWLY